LWSSPGLCETYTTHTADVYTQNNFSIVEKRLRKRFSTAYFDAAAFSWRASFSSNVVPQDPVSFWSDPDRAAAQKP
jgi:hypothetical protein